MFASSNVCPAGLKRNISVRIAQNAPDRNNPQHNSAALREAGAAQVWRGEGAV